MLTTDELKRRIDAARTLRGLRQVDLAELLEADGHGKHDVGRLERGEIPFSASLRRSLAHHLQVPDDWFVAIAIDDLIAHEASSDIAVRLEQIDDKINLLLVAAGINLPAEPPAAEPVPDHLPDASPHRRAAGRRRAS